MLFFCEMVRVLALLPSSVQGNVFHVLLPAWAGFCRLLEMADMPRFRGVLPRSKSD